MINEVFHQKNIRVTSQRKLVLELISKLGEEATLKRIVDEVGVLIDKSTVYRIINLFVEKEILEKMVNYQDEVYYSLKGEHEHYFFCVKCHKKEKLDICPINDIEEVYEKSKGYKILDHSLAIHGICAHCLGNK